nr:hypothetical protein [Tanacetum cinerariifolium]
MSSDSHATITYTSMSSYEVIVNGYYGMPMDPLDPYVQLVMGAPPSPDYIPRPEAPPSPDYIPGPKAPPSPDYIPRPEALPSPDYIPGPEYPEYLPPADDMLPAKEQPLPAAENDGDDEKSEGDSIDYPTSGGDNDANDDGDDLSKDDADDEDEEESSDKVERLLAIPTPPLSSVSLTSYTLPPLLMPLPIFTLLPTLSFPLPSSIPSTSGSESIPEADIPLRKRARFTTPTSRYEIGENSIAAAARQIRPTLTIADKRRADDKLIGRLRSERRYFCTLATTYAQEDAHSRDYCTRIMGYCQSRKVHTRTLVTQIEALQRDVSTLQRQHIEHAQRDVAPETTTATEPLTQEKMAPKRARTTRANPDPTRTTTATEPLTQEVINNLIAQRVSEFLAEYKTQRNSVVNRDTSNTTGTGPRTVRPTRECTYKDYLNCGPLKFNGTKGVIGLTRWFERTEFVFSISNCIAENQVKGMDITSYTLRFQELTLLCGKMFSKESGEIE